MQRVDLRFGKLFQCVVILGGEKHQHRIGLDPGLDELPPNNRGVLFISLAMRFSASFCFLLTASGSWLLRSTAAV